MQAALGLPASSLLRGGWNSNNAELVCRNDLRDRCRLPNLQDEWRAGRFATFLGPSVSPIGDVVPKVLTLRRKEEKSARSLTLATASHSDRNIS